MLQLVSLNLSNIFSLHAQLFPLINENLTVSSKDRSSDIDFYFRLSVCALESYYLLIRYSVYCRWDFSTGSQKGWSWLAQFFYVGNLYFEFSLPSFSSSVFTSLSIWLPGLHRKKSANYSICTQPILCPIFKSFIIVLLDILLRISRCFVSSLSHSLSWSMFCASVTCNPHSFFRSTRKRIIFFSCSKGLTYFNLSEIQLVSRSSHDVLGQMSYLCLSSHSLNTAVCSILSTCHLMSPL